MPYRKDSATSIHQGCTVRIADVAADLNNVAFPLSILAGTDYYIQATYV